MAYKLNTQIDNTGFEADYWRVIDVYYHFDRNETVVTLALYKSAEDREAGKLPVNETRHIVISEIVNDPRKAVYEKIKTLETKETVDGEEVVKPGEFATAEDLI